MHLLKIQLVLLSSLLTLTFSAVAETPAPKASPSVSPGGAPQPTPSPSASPAPAPMVQWYFPRRHKKLETGRIEIYLSGRTLPGAVILPKSDGIAVLGADGKIKQLSAAETILSETPAADSQGYFLFKLALPPGNAQVPVVLKTDSGEQLFQLNLNVQDNKIELSNAGNLKSDRGIRRSHSIWVGVGIAGETYEENSPDAGIDVNYASYKGPTLVADGHYVFSDHWEAVASIKDIPGNANPDSNISVANPPYNITLITLDGLYTREKWNFPLFKRDTAAFFRFGFEHQSIPYLAKVSTTEVTVQNFSTTFAELGPQLDMRLNHSTNLEAYVMYQYPLINSGSVKLDPGTMIKGSVGANMMINSAWSAGLYWYFEMENSSFTYSGTAAATGTQSIFFSGVDARLGYIFP